MQVAEFAIDLFILCIGYYCFSYGIHLWKIEHNKLAGFGVFLIALLGTILPIVFYHIKM
jgi:hypothetical protein